MHTLDKPVWKIAAESFVMALGGAGFFAGFEWVLEQSGVGEASHLKLALTLAFGLVLLWPLFYGLVRQRAILAKIEKEREEELLRDDTTRLYKSKVFKELAATQIRLCKRNNWPVGLVVMDIDRLGSINEKHGYDAGNQVLKHFAGVIRDSVRESDLMARFDDDRFALLLPNCDAKDAKRVIQRIQNLILSEPLEVGKATIKIPFSCGVVSFAGKVAKFNLMVNRATEALERAKGKGGNRIELF